MFEREWFYDRDGVPIPVDRWAELNGNQVFKRPCPRTRVIDAAGVVVRDVSTVWLGIDMGFGLGPPLIFETMVFAEDGDISESPTDLDHGPP